MDNELAKKLKDAGFPEEMIGERVRGYYSPTLSELIEACGNEFRDLLKKQVPPNSVDDNIPLWIARASDISYFGYGSTPKEAVANLWIKLGRAERREA